MEKSQRNRQRLLSQTRIAIEAAKFTINESILLNDRPADRVISYFFKNNRKLGSRDRRLILESIYPMLRWWGLIKTLILKAVKHDELQKHGISNISDHILLKAITCSIILQNAHTLENEILELWVKEVNLKKFQDSIQHENSILKKCQFFNNFFKISSDSSVQLIPEWIDKELENGISMELLTKYTLKRPPMWIRAQQISPEKLMELLKKQDFELKQHNTIKNALALYNPKINLYNLEEFNQGYFEVQDLASQSIGIACSPKPGERWWDACAGAGGKSLQLASMMNNKGRIVASDIREFKLEDLKKRAKRSNFYNISYSGWNGRKLPAKKREKFDGVLVDAPCSCSGTWRRNPDAKWNSSPEEIEEISELQLKLLSNAADAVRPNGVLVYATCSLFTRENFGVVESFLNANNQFKLIQFKNPISHKMTTGTLQIYPWDSDCDATFIAKLKKTSK